MLPKLLEIGSITIHSYGLLLAVSFVVGIQLALGEGRRRGLPEPTVANLALWIMGLSIGGARLVYVLTHLSSFEGRWLDVLKLWQGGLTLYGGLTAAMVGTLVLTWHGRLPLGTVFDTFTPSVALGEGISRIGCFLNGCCFGKACDLPWGVTFPEHAHATTIFGGQPVHPTQLYLSAIGFLSFVLLWAVRRRISTPGRLFFLFLVIESVSRFAIDFLRYYSETGESWAVFGAALSISQVLSLCFLALAVGGLVLRPARRRPAEAEAEA